MNYAALIKAINSTTTQLQGRAAAAVNQALVIRNWMVGSYLVEFEQTGKDRAKYGARLLEKLAADLAEKKVKGLGDPRILRDCRVLYLTYPGIRGAVSREFELMVVPPAIRGTVSREFPESPRIRQALSVESGATSIPAIPATLSPESTALSIRGAATPELPAPLSPGLLLRFSWSQLQELIRIDDPWKRAFFENECLKGHWSVRQLQRQIGSLLYERTGLSIRKKTVVERARKQEPTETIADLLRDPYVLEFAGLSDLPSYSEKQLETALLDHLQRFLLELGRGFCFEARQFRITEGRKHHRVDLVFYHRLLRCHVLIDLKIRPFQPADAGQMNFYVNWFNAHMQAPGDVPPIGILLCSDKDGAEVEFATAGMDQKLFVSRYLTALPSAAKLRAFLETDRERIESLLPSPAAKPAKRKRTP
jgi:predicted nuclease of restriction endonuclease-like (RecB) superfamily